MSPFFAARALLFVTAATHAALQHDWQRDVMVIASLLKEIAASIF